MANATITEAEVVSRIEKRGWGKFTNRLWVACGLGWMSDAMNIASLSLVLPLIIAEMGLTRADAGLLASGTYAGFMIGGVVIGKLSDIVGRRTLLVFNILLFSFASLLAGFATNYEYLLVVRFIQGLGLGAEFPIIGIYLNELTSKKNLNAVVGLTTGFFAYGFALTPLIGIFVVPELGWRGLFWVLVIPAILALYIRRRLPETPSFLARKGRVEEARQALEMIEAETPEAPVQAQSAAAGQQGAPLYLPMVLSLIGTWILIFLAQYGFVTWVPTVVKQQLGDANSYLLTALMFSGMIVGYIGGGFLGSRLSTNKFIWLAFIEFGISLILVGYASSLTALIIFGWFASAGYGLTSVASYAYTPQQFETRVRGTGMGLATGIGRVGAIVGAPLAGWLTPTGSFGLSFLVFGLASFATIALVHLSNALRRQAVRKVQQA